MAPDHETSKRAPHAKPPFTLSQLKKAIPPHCFKRSILRSSFYLAYDLAIAYAFYYVANNYIHLLPHPLPYVAWPIYWLCQGCVLTGVWVIAHECGHQAFSDYQWVNDAVGLVLHSFLLVPYFSWKISHRKHHSNPSSLENDEVYVPKKRSELTWYSKAFSHPPGRLFTTLYMVFLGLQLYFAINVAGKSYDKFASHYYPYSPIYSDRERIEIFISDAGVLAVVYLLYRLVLSKGLAWVLCLYGGPVAVVNSFIVIITYLHHTHPALPHYDSSEWEWLRGSLSTVDRDYGILNKVFHNITDTHVAHHLFSSIPHYHAMEATNAIRPILGEYYQIDRTPFLKALWRDGNKCIYIAADEDDGHSTGVFWYRHKL